MSTSRFAVALLSALVIVGAILAGSTELEGTLTKVEPFDPKNPMKLWANFRLDRMAAATANCICSRRVGDTHGELIIDGPKRFTHIDGKFFARMQFAKHASVGQRYLFESDGPAAVLTSTPAHQEGKIAAVSSSSFELFYYLQRIRIQSCDPCGGAKAAASRDQGLGKAQYGIVLDKSYTKSIPATSSTVYLYNGQRSTREQVLKKGEYCLIYPARGQTVIGWPREALRVDTAYKSAALPSTYPACLGWRETYIKGYYGNATGSYEDDFWLRFEYFEDDGTLMDVCFKYKGVKTAMNGMFQHLEIEVPAANNAHEYMQRGMFAYPGRQASIMPSRCGKEPYMLLLEADGDSDLEGWVKKSGNGAVEITRMKQGRPVGDVTVTFDADVKYTFCANHSNAAEVFKPGNFVRILSKRDVTVSVCRNAGFLGKTPPAGIGRIEGTESGVIVSRTPASSVGTQLTVDLSARMAQSISPRCTWINGHGAIKGPILQVIDNSRARAYDFQGRCTKLPALAR